MANTNNPRGLRPLVLGTVSPRVNEYVANVTTAIYAGDVVQMLSSGKVKTITTTTGPDTIIGVAQNYVAVSSSASPVWVYDDPDQEFEIQDDGLAATAAQTNVGNSAALILTTGNTTTKISKQSLDISSAGTTSLEPLKILGFIQGVGREIGKYSTMRVRFNRHMFGNKIAGI